MRLEYIGTSCAVSGSIAILVAALLDVYAIGAIKRSQNSVSLILNILIGLVLYLLPE